MNETRASHSTREGQPSFTAAGKLRVLPISILAGANPFASLCPLNQYTVRHQMEESLFHVLLGIGLIEWIRLLIDRPSASQLDELKSMMAQDPAKIPKFIAAIALLLLSVVGLIGMFFVPTVFRWIYLVAVAGMIVGIWFIPVASNKPKHDIAFAVFFRLVDGAILALAFSGLVASSTEPTIGDKTLQFESELPSPLWIS